MTTDLMHRESDLHLWHQHVQLRQDMSVLVRIVREALDGLPIQCGCTTAQCDRCVLEEIIARNTE